MALRRSSRLFAFENKIQRLNKRSIISIDVHFKITNLFRRLNLRTHSKIFEI